MLTAANFDMSAMDAATLNLAPSVRAYETPPSAKPEIQIAVVTTLEELRDLRRDWTELHQAAAPAGNPFQSHGWCLHWANKYLTDAKCQLFVVTARDNGRLTLVMPLVREQMNGLSRLTWLGAPVTQYGDVLVHPRTPTETIDAAWKLVTTQPGVDLIELYKVREDARINPWLQRSNALVTHEDFAPAADFGSFAQFADYAEQRFSKKRRAYLKRYRRRFEDSGTLRFEVFSEGPEARAAAQEILDMKAAWLKEKGLISRAFQDERTAEFFLDTASDPGNTTGCRVMRLLIGDELIAGALNYVTKDGCVAHVITYKMDYEKWSPGHLLTLMTLEYCLENGMRSYDFMGPLARFKLDWADKTVPVNDYALPTSLKGHLWSRLYLGLIRDRLKQIYLRLPLGLRKFAAGGMSGYRAAGKTSQS